MAEAPFFIRPGRGRKYISTADRSLEVAVYQLNQYNFIKKYGTIVWYGMADGHPVAFETKANIDKTDMITEAIRWYAAEINEPEMVLSLTDPRSAIIN
jgi:hypothetical protein